MGWGRRRRDKGQSKRLKTRLSFCSFDLEHESFGTEGPKSNLLPIHPILP